MMTDEDSPVAPGAPERSRVGWLVVALVAAVGIVGVIAYIVVTGDDGGEDAPEEVVRAFLSAQANQDCERGVDLLSERVVEESGGREEVIDDCEDNQDDDDVADEDLAQLLDSLETTAVEADRATVTYTTPGDADPVTIEVALVRQDDAWKVDDIVPVVGDLPEDSPQAAARDHAQAVLDEDCAAFLAVLSEQARAELGDTAEERQAQCDRYVGRRDPDARLGPVFEESRDDDVAVIGITIISESYEGGNTIFYVTVVDEDGGWKVDQLDWSDEPS